MSAATRLGVQIYDQPGRVPCILPTPNGKISNLCFGGENFDTRFATGGDKVFKRKLKVKGARLGRPPSSRRRRDSEPRRAGGRRTVYERFAPLRKFTRPGFCFNCALVPVRVSGVTIEMFRKEIAAAVKAYDMFIVCLAKSPEEFEAALAALMQKAINAYEGRAAGMRHGIALDKQVTIILSQSDTARPLCGIYFNLHSPYQKNALPKTVKAIGESPTAAEDMA